MFLYLTSHIYIFASPPISHLELLPATLYSSMSGLAVIGSINQVMKFSYVVDLAGVLLGTWQGYFEMSWALLRFLV